MLAATSLAIGAWLLPAPPVQAVPGPATDEQVAAAIAGAQNYLYYQFIDDGNGLGHWADYNDLTGTSAAVAALIESGKMADPLYRERIDKGIAFIKTKVKSNGGIYERYNEAYETGMALVALALYGQATTTDAGFRTIVQNAVNFLKSYQNIEGSQRGGDYGPLGEATTTNAAGCNASYNVGNYYGGWGYYPGDDNTNKCVTEGDLSNTQFVVMGLWYGSRYLGAPIDSAPWAKALLYFLKNQQQASGGFNVYVNNGDYAQRTGTASAMWSLAMIGQTAAKKNPSDTNTMVQNAVNWYATGTQDNWSMTPAYSWNNPDAYMYFIYAMSKALTATIGPAAMVGTNNWALDMKTELVNSQFRTSSTFPDNSASDFWDSRSGLDPEGNAQTAWVLMSLAFASTSTPSTEKLLAQEDLLDNIVRGLVTLHTTNGVTISAATRGNTAQANVGQNVVLPIGSVSFTLNNVPVGGTAVLSIQPPAGALDPTLPSSFVNADGSLKAGLSWFKIVGADWKGQASVPISIDLNQGVILVTLTDGGPEDADGVANGTIVDPGAPGFGAASVAGGDSGGGFFGCTTGNGRPDPTLALLLIGGIAFLVRRRRNRT